MSTTPRTRQSPARRRAPHVRNRAIPEAAASPGDRQESDWWLEREIDILRRALEDKDEMRRRDLGNLVGCKYWGPGRFAAALTKASARGDIEHTGLGRYGPASQHG